MLPVCPQCQSYEDVCMLEHVRALGSPKCEEKKCMNHPTWWFYIMCFITFELMPADWVLGFGRVCACVCAWRDAERILKDDVHTMWQQIDRTAYLPSCSVCIKWLHFSVCIGELVSVSALICLHPCVCAIYTLCMNLLWAVVLTVMSVYIVCLWSHCILCGEYLHRAITHVWRVFRAETKYIKT